jgi:hypothetical protein
MAGSERKRELRRRRKRTKSMDLLRRKAAKATAAEKEVLIAKVRRMTTGAEDALKSLGLA